MKCLTKAEIAAWMKLAGFAVGHEDKPIVESVLPKYHKHLMIDVPNEALRLHYFSARLVQWLPNGSPRILFLTDWHTYPPAPLTTFETLRLGCGEARHIIDAPGHLFEAFEGGNDDFYKDKPSALLTGIVSLALGYDWYGYLASQTPMEYIVLGDGFISFSTASDEKFDEAKEIAKTFELRQRGQSS
jgi:hypothetical protein